MSRTTETLAQRIKLARKMRKMTQAELAVASGMKQPDISKMELGTMQKTTGIARLAAALGVSATWLELNEGPTPEWGNPSPPTRGVAHSLSLEQHIVTSQQLIPWEELVNPDKLPGRFSLLVRDDAMAPLLNAGHYARFTRGGVPSPGKPVLVLDSDGNAYIRVYQAGRGDRWQAVATGPGFAPMDSETDGLRVIARLTGIDWEE